MALLSVTLDTRRHVEQPGVRGWIAGLVGFAALFFSLATVTLTNDQFGRISPARQIAAYGEWPFRDFLEPGYFLTEFASAAMLRVFGDSLLGEWLLTSAFMAAGTALVFALAWRASKSYWIALTSAAVVLLSFPRAYDYDKVLFYPLGLFLCWRYSERQGARTLWILAAGLVLGALFRYDTGMYIACAALTVIGITHAGDLITAGRRAGLFIIAVSVLSLPFLALLQYQGGVLNAADQMVTYGRRETARTRIAEPPRFSVGTHAQDPHVEDTNRGEGRESGVWTFANANAFLYHVLRWLPLLASVILVRDVRSTTTWPRAEVACVASLAVTCMLLNIFILRNPVYARVGGMAGPAAILWAWMASRVWDIRTGLLRYAAASAMAMIFLLTLWSLSTTMEWERRLKAETLSPGSVKELASIFSQSPPSLRAIPNPSLIGIVSYLRECTGARDRVFAAWFVPELYFFAQRGFAGSVAIFDGHWSEPRFQQRMIDAFSSRSVPVVIVESARYDDFLEAYSLLGQYLDEHYSVAGTTDFGNPAGNYTLLVDKNRSPIRTHPASGMPCF